MTWTQTHIGNSKIKHIPGIVFPRETSVVLPIISSNIPFGRNMVGWTEGCWQSYVWIIKYAKTLA
jgi:hypothetical protein